MVRLIIKEVAESRGITTAYQLQKAMDVHPGQAAKLWKGEIEMVGLKTINHLCAVLECLPGDLFEYSPDKSAKKKAIITKS